MGIRLKPVSGWRLIMIAAEGEGLLELKVVDEIIK